MIQNLTICYKKKNNIMLNEFVDFKAENLLDDCEMNININLRKHNIVFNQLFLNEFGK